MFAANPQGLQQRYAMNQDLLDLLALQKLKKDKEAAQRSLQMQMQPESGTVKDQLEGQMMQATKQEVASALAPGIQQQGQAMQAQQLQQAMGGGVASQPAPNMVGMARGGIVGYAPGGDVEGEEPTTPYGRARGRRTTEAERIRDEMNLPGDMSRDELAAMQELTKRYSRAAGPLGIFAPQTDEERTLAQQVMQELPNMSYADRLAVLATGEIPSATEPQTPVERNPYVPLGPDASLARRRDEPRATEASAGLPSLVPQRVIDDPENEANVAMATETLPAMQRAQREAPQDPRMSRYEDQLARLEAEEKDKLGSLIDFLLAAGASGGTNLGATLMGGGSGLQAREQRIQDEMTKTIQNIETLQLEREKMASEDEQARLSRENQLAVARVQSQNQQRPTDTALTVDDYTTYFMAQNPGMSEVEARFKAREYIQANEIARAQAASGARLPLQESTLLTGLRTQAQESALEYLSGQGNFRPTSQEIDTETNRQYKALLIAAGMDPEQDQSTVPQGQDLSGFSFTELSD
jgi:hypothetical protein